MLCMLCYAVWFDARFLFSRYRRRRRRCRRFLSLVYMYRVVRMDFPHYSILFRTFFNRQIYTRVHVTEKQSAWNEEREREEEKKELWKLLVKKKNEHHQQQQQ